MKNFSTSSPVSKRRRRTRNTRRASDDGKNSRVGPTAYATRAARAAEGFSMKIESKDFRVRPGGKVKLEKWPTSVKPYCGSKEAYQELLGEHVEELADRQRLHYASDRYALLLIFQGMDAAGKDGAIRHVMSGVNPQGCE